jgi:hypothetical protein
VVASVGSLGGPCEFTCWPEGIDDEVLHVGSSVPWAGQGKSYGAVQRCLGWSKGGDDEVLHLVLLNFLGGPKQAICCHAKMSQLAQRR